jgi:murein DD-endopeptidase MepM/ murein hydrolase activator NlpD
VRRPSRTVWDWSFFEDGALALDRHELWTEIEPATRFRLLQAKVHDDLNESASSVTVRRMPRQSSAQARRSARAHGRAGRRRAGRRQEHRLRRFALLTIIAAVSVVTLALTAFNESAAPRVAALAPAPAQRLLPVGSPQPLVIAKLGDLRLQMPISSSRVTAIGYHGAGEGALAFQPVGRQANEGLLARLGHKLFGGSSHGPVWYQISGGTGPHTSGLDVGATAGTSVYSPVDGRVVGLTPYIINGQPYGERIDIQPARAPSVVVSLTHVGALASLSVGSMVTAAQTRIGTVMDLTGVERQSLAEYTTDSGNHVAIEAHPAATLALS